MVTRFLLATILLLACSALASGMDDAERAAEQPAANDPTESVTQVATDSAPGRLRLRLKNNSFGVGKIVPCDQAQLVGWLNDGFEQPFLFSIDAIRSITQIEAATQASPPDKQIFLVESIDGQSITGRIIGIDDQHLTIQSPLLGQVKVVRSQVHQLIRADYSGEIVYPGLSQQAPWTALSQPRDWEFRAGTLTALKQGAVMRGEVNLPAKCELSFSLGWRGVPDFVFSFGVAPQERGTGQVAAAARLEVWNKNIVMVRETDKDADLARLMELSEKSPQVELNLLIDQVKGLVIARDMHGRTLGRIQAAPSGVQEKAAVHIVNHGPSLTIERLEVRSWNGSSMIGTDGNSSVMLSDGRTWENSWLSGFDSTEELFLLENTEGPIAKVPAEELLLAGFRHDSSLRHDKATADDSSEVALNPSRPAGSGTKPDPSNSTEANSAGTTGAGTTNLDAAAAGADRAGQEHSQSVELLLADRSRFQGNWLACEGDMLTFQTDWSQDLLRFAATDIVGLVGYDQRFAADLTSQRNGTLKIGDTELSGYLQADVVGEGPQSLRWQPHGSQSSSAVSSTAEGSITYRLQLPLSSSGQPTGRLSELFDQPRADVASAASAKLAGGSNRATREIVFVGGDTIDGYVERADEQAVYFLSEQSPVRSVEQRLIDRCWLNSMASGIKPLDSEKLQRLMTVPRSSRDDPPTHLLISVSGDYLRGRLVELNEQWVRVEVRSEVAQIPRDKVAQIIWLHQRNWQVSTTEQRPSAEPYQIHVVQHDRGLTFHPQGVAEGVIHGNSPLLGDCRIPVKQISQILFGPGLQRRIAEFRENPWVLSLAQLPKAFNEVESMPTTGLGISSPLIGQPAPAFLLEQLDGQNIKLGELTGKVVVLEFWASWCGPCMKALPIVAEVSASFDPARVTMIAVNVQESTSRAEAAAARLSLPSIVALDRQGDVATSYHANTIPWTVVIDKQGVVRYLFSGTRSQFAQQLQQAIADLLE